MIKIKGVISALLILNAVSSQAQFSGLLKGVDEIVISAGPSLSFLRGSSYVGNNDVITRTLKRGHTFGIGATQRVNDKVGLTGMLLAENKGTITNFLSSYFDEVTQTRKPSKVSEEYIYYNYTLTLAAHYTLKRKPSFQHSYDRKSSFHIGAGTFISYLKKQIVKTTRYPQGTGGIEDQTFANKNLEFGVAIQFSFRMPLNQQIALQAQLLNMLGLTNTRADPNYGIIKTNATSLLVGIIINTSKNK